MTKDIMDEIDDIIDDMVTDKVSGALDKALEIIHLKKVDEEALTTEIEAFIDKVMDAKAYPADANDLPKRDESAYASVLNMMNDANVSPLLNFYKLRFLMFTVASRIAVQTLRNSPPEFRKAIFSWLHTAYLDGLTIALKAERNVEKKRKEKREKEAREKHPASAAPETPSDPPPPPKSSEVWPIGVEPPAAPLSSDEAGETGGSD